MELNLDTNFVKVIRDVGKLAESVSPAATLDWCDQIEITVKHNCGEDITFKGRINEQGKLELKLEAARNEIGCIIAAIKELQGKMPYMTKEYWNAFIQGIDAEGMKV